MASTYVFREDLEADKQRAADAAQTNPIATLGAPQAPTLPAAPQAAPQPAPMPSAPAAPSQAENPFQAFSKALEAQNPFKQQVKQNVQQTLANPGAAAEAANAAARDRLARENNAAQEETRSQAISNYGGYQTGQAGQSLDKFRNSRLMNEQSFELEAAANKAGVSEQARSNAINQGIGLLGQEEQSQLTREQLAQNERLQDKQIGSQEKLAYAGLDLEKNKFAAADANAKQGLSLEASAQALQKLGMDKEEAYKYASLSQAKSLAEKGLTLEESAQALEKLGMDRQNAQYYAGLAQQDKLTQAEIASREKLAYAQIGSGERMQLADQNFQTAQKELDRSLEKMLSTDRIQAQFQLSALDRQFQEKMQSAGFVQEKDLETMRADLQKSLQARGIDAATATQIADQKFTELMAGKDQAFQQQMNTIKQSFITGERVSSQDWESAMHATDLQHDETMAKLTSTLRLGEAANAQAFQTAFQGMQNEFSEKMATSGFSHEEAMQSVAQNFQLQLEREGYTHEEAMQGAQLAVQVSENQMNRASQELMAAAQLASSDMQFQSELLQKYQLSSQDLEIRREELGANLKLMGLQGEQLQAAIQNDKVKSAMDIAALGMEIGNGSPESMAPFVEQFGAALSGYMKEQGIDISQSDFVKAMTTTTAPGTGSSADGFKQFGTVIDTKSNLAPEMADTLKTYLTTLTNAYASAKPGTIIPLSTGRGADFDAAVNKLRQLGATQGVLDTYIHRDKTGDSQFGTGGVAYKGTQAFADYAAYVKLLGSGLNEKDAQAAIGNLIGPDRTSAAFMLERMK